MRAGHSAMNRKVFLARDPIVKSGKVSVLMPRTLIGIPLWVVFGIVGAWIATTKGRGGCFWFALCAALGPFGLALAAVVSRTRN